MVYNVRANPELHESGEFEGNLDFVRFTADVKSRSHREWKVAAEDLDRCLHTLENNAVRRNVLSKLRAGARVELPDSYTAAQLTALGFGAGN
jgi:hypothetical protein